jgi:beta-mannosidase
MLENFFPFADLNAQWTVKLVKHPTVAELVEIVNKSAAEHGANYVRHMDEVEDDDLLPPAKVLKKLSEGIEARVPGTVQDDLVRLGLCPDPTCALDTRSGAMTESGYWPEVMIRWVAESVWEYSVTLELPEKVLKAHKLGSVVFDGVDTHVAEVWINDHATGTTNANKFVRFRTPPTGLSRSLSVRVRILPIRALADTRAQRYPVALRGDSYVNGIANRMFVRKAQSDFGWDWGVSVMPVGIHEQVRLWCSPMTSVPPRCVFLPLRTETGDWSVQLSAPEVTGGLLTQRIFRMWRVRDVLPNGEVTVLTEKPLFEKRLVDGSQVVTVPAALVEEWNVRGGADDTKIQPLYRCTVVYGKELLASRSAVVGFRSVHLRREQDAARWRVPSLDGLRLAAASPPESAADRVPDDAESFELHVNGRLVIVLGADLVPVTEEQEDRVLGALIAANANCLRVWGGGNYASDRLLTKCDAAGILVVHDFAFACGLYPVGDPDFLASVRVEIRQALTRFSAHPSVCLLVGNNECEQQLGYTRQQATYPKLRDDYARLFEQIVPEEVRAVVGTSIPYWPSSPSSGPHRLGTDPFVPHSGTVHYWSVWHDGQPFSHAGTLRPRFVPEFGFQSLPQRSTLLAAARPTPGSLTDYHSSDMFSRLLEFVQRSPAKGNAQIVLQLAAHYRQPSTIDGWIFMSQLNQARALEYAISCWRRLIPYNTGIIYWQLNDTWRGASWSSLDVEGRWKLLHYKIREVYAPIALSATLTPTSMIAVWIASKRYEQAALPPKVRVRIRFYSDRGSFLSARLVTPPTTALPPLSATHLSSTPVVAGAAFATVDLLANDGAIPAGMHTTRKVVFITEPKTWYLPSFSTDVAVRVAAGDDGRVVTIVNNSTTALAPAVSLFQEDTASLGHFSSNVLWLHPGESRDLRYSGTGGAADGLVVRTLVNPDDRLPITIGRAGRVGGGGGGGGGGSEGTREGSTESEVSGGEARTETSPKKVRKKKKSGRQSTGLK